MKKFLNRIRIGNVIFAVAALAIGVFMLVKPGAATSLICRLVGVVALVGGTAMVVTGLSPDRFPPLRVAAEAIGAILAVAGLWVVIAPGTLAKFLFVMIGVMLIINGLFDFFSCTTIGVAHGSGLLFMLLSVVTIILGVAVIAHPFEAADVVMRFAGLSLIADGVIDILVTAAVAKAAKRNAPAVVTVEADSVEEL